MKKKWASGNVGSYNAPSNLTLFKTITGLSFTPRHVILSYSSVGIGQIVTISIKNLSEIAISSTISASSYSSSRSVYVPDGAFLANGFALYGSAGNVSEMLFSDIRWIAFE